MARNKRQRQKTREYKNSVSGLAYTVISQDSVVLPQDVYREQSSVTRALFGVYDYLPFIQVGELEHLNALITNSATAQSIVSKIATYTVGEGFYIPKKRKVLGDVEQVTVTDEEKRKLANLLTRQNQSGDTLLDICYKAAFDLAAFGNAFAQLKIVDSMGDNYTFISHQQTNFVRPFRSLDLITRYFGVSLDWASIPAYTSAIPNWGAMSFEQKQREIQAREIPAEVFTVPAYPVFSLPEEPANPEEYYSRITADGEYLGAEDRNSMLHVKQYAPQMYFWGLPEWTGSKHWVELEYRIAKFNISKFKNGLQPSGILTVFADMTDEEKHRYIADMKAKMTDTGNDFKVIVNVLENPDLKAQWQSFEQSYQGYFMELATLCKEFIAIGMGFPLSLVQATSGQLGNNQQIRSEFEILYNTKIYYIQQSILKNIVKPYLATVAKEEEGYDFLLGLDLDFINVIPVSFSGDLEIEKYITVNEGREVIGFPELEEGGEMTVSEEEAAEEKTAIARFFNLFNWRK